MLLREGAELADCGKLALRHVGTGFNAVKVARVELKAVSLVLYSQSQNISISDSAKRGSVYANETACLPMPLPAKLIAST